MDLAARYKRVRSLTQSLCQTLVTEDFVIQTMPDASPTKWHLAHVTWFFESFVLGAANSNYRCVNESYHYLFNSYYQSAGKMHPRPQRGFLSRPTVAEIMDYRGQVDDRMLEFMVNGVSEEQAAVIELGINHEQQHQELLLTDIKHVFSCNPSLPALKSAIEHPRYEEASERSFTAGINGTVEIGHKGEGFGFDNEFPRHAALLQRHGLASRLVTNGEYLAFIESGAYQQPEWWLSDGWTTVNCEGWNRPLYWSKDLQSEFTLCGLQDLDLHAPVCHVSLYEADAFARWSDARLPTEFEWESAAANEPVTGNLLENGTWHPIAAAAGQSQWFGDVWEWTSSAYAAYPGFRPLAGSLGEYNGKFMCNQATVRGGSCVTSTDHIRATYRSFFYPQQRWQFLGFRLARDND